MDSTQKIRVAGYVKLAKLWEKRREDIIPYHEQYYRDMFYGVNEFELVGVYVDITGNKEIFKRAEMLRLIKDCVDGKVDCITSMTKGYLAANMRDFSYLFKYLLDEIPAGIDFITEDESTNNDETSFYIDTISNEDDQKGALKKMVEEFVSLCPEEYEIWKDKVNKAIGRMK